MGDYQALLSMSRERLMLAGNMVHSVNAEKKVLLEALHEAGVSVLYSMQALLWLDRLTLWDAMEGKTDFSLIFSFKEAPEDFFQRFARIAGKYGFGLGEIGALQEIFHFGERYERGIDFQHSYEENQFALAVLNFERFLTLFENASQFAERVFIVRPFYNGLVKKPLLVT